jgi:aquaporin-4
MTAVLYCVRNVTDAHINPSVTVALLVTRRTSVIRSLLYLVAQFLGAIVGAGLLLAVTASEYRTNRTWPGGCTVPAEYVSEGQAFGVEFFATFFFVFVVACYDKVKSDMKSLAPPFIIGSTYAAVILFSLPYTGGSINTARSFGPAIVNVVWRDHWVYWFGPIIGGVCGGAVFDVIFSTKSSFQRITACFTVFHAKPHDDQAGADQALRDKDPEYQCAAEVPTIAVTTSCAVDETEEGEGSHPGAADEQKPRLKLFARPKFACCSSKETGQ